MLLPGVQEAHSEQQRGADNSPQACRKSARGQATDPNEGWVQLETWAQSILIRLRNDYV